MWYKLTSTHCRSLPLQFECGLDSVLATLKSMRHVCSPGSAAGSDSDSATRWGWRSADRQSPAASPTIYMATGDVTPGFSTSLSMDDFYGTQGFPTTTK